METFVATTNIFVVANIEATNGGRGTVEILVTSQDGNTRSSKASAHYYTGGDVYVQYNSCSMLMLPGEECVINVTQTNPKVTVTTKRIEF